MEDVKLLKTYSLFEHSFVEAVVDGVPTKFHRYCKRFGGDGRTWLEFCQDNSRSIVHNDSLISWLNSLF